MPQGDVLEQNANVQDEEMEEGEVIKPSAGPLDDDSSDDDAEQGNDTADNESEPAKPEPQKERPVYTMPVAKAQEEKKRAVERALEEARKEAEAERLKLQQEYEAKLAGFTSKDELTSEIEKVAAEEGLDPNAAKKLFSAFKKGLPELSTLETMKKEREVEAHKLQVSQEFDGKVAPLILKDYPQATPAHIQQVKERIAELAFSQGYNT